MSNNKQERSEEVRFLVFLRIFKGIDSQSGLFRLTGIARADISRYESGKQKPHAATFRKIVEGLGISPHQLAFLRWCHHLLFRARASADRLDKAPPSEPRVPEDARAAAVDILERALAMARAEHALLRAEAEKTGPPPHGKNVP